LRNGEFTLACDRNGVALRSDTILSSDIDRYSITSFCQRDWVSRNTGRNGSPVHANDGVFTFGNCSNLRASGEKTYRCDVVEHIPFKSRGKRSVA
jgi:hypothetical protein